MSLSVTGGVAVAMDGRFFRKYCVACGRSDAPMNKEHFFPAWLIEYCDVRREGIAWRPGQKNVNPEKAKFPICERCNGDFGSELEAPMARILRDLEAGRGISDEEAELIVRWMWKFEGLGFVMNRPSGVYTMFYSLRDRVLNPIDRIRGELTLAVALAAERDPEYADGSMGLDTPSSRNAIHVAGVFSRVSLLVTLTKFAAILPSAYSRYELAPRRGDPGWQAKLFYPRTTFRNCTEATRANEYWSPRLAILHDRECPPWPWTVPTRGGAPAP